MSAAGKNLAAIDAALRQHGEGCGSPVLAILLNLFEVDRLGWDDYQGIPIKPDSSLGTGRFRLMCEGNHLGSGDAVGSETPVPTAIPIEAPEPNRIPVTA